MRARLLGFTALAGALYAAYAAACPVSQAWGRGFHRGPRRGAGIALTFDDGPSEETPAVLEVLERHEVRAAFFLCGLNVERLPRTARRVAEAGHEIGNHTYSHPFLLGLRADAVRREVMRAQQAIADSVGAEPRLFRAPWGVKAPGLRAALEECGLIAVRWTVMGYDWRNSAEWIANHVTSKADAGGIVCLHDGHGTRARPDRGPTVAALDSIIPELKRRGFRFVTPGDMLDALRSKTARPA